MLLAWVAVAFGLVGAAYAGVGPRIFGKRPDGRMAPLAVVLLLPYLVLLWTVWHAYRLVTRTRAWDRLNERVILGRRLMPAELPAEVTAVLDLTAEFFEPAAIVRRVRYVSCPILDARDLPVDDLRRALAAVAEEKCVYVHCAQGHGRTGLVAAALLVVRGEAASAEEALARVREVRRGVRLNARQRRCLEALTTAGRTC